MSPIVNAFVFRVVFADNAGGGGEMQTLKIGTSTIVII